MLPACRVRSLDRIGSLVILPALGSLEQFRYDAGIVVDDAVGQQPRAFAPELLLLIGSDSQFAAVGIRDRAHQFVIGLAAVERSQLSSSHSAFFVRFFIGYELSLAMMTLCRVAFRANEARLGCAGY